MVPELRRAFNASFSPGIAESYRKRISSRLSCEINFRLAETPVFFSKDLINRFATAANEIIAMISDPTTIARMAAAVPGRWNVPGLDRLPNFAQVDFAAVRAASGEIVPRLVELQGFPSLSAFEVFQSEAWQESLASLPGTGGAWSSWPGLTRAEFLRLAQRAIVGAHDPVEVVLLDLDPERQKTFPDFRATKILFGVDAIDPRALLRRGRRLFRTDAAGHETPVRRIYNRVVFDELEKTGAELPFDYRDPLDVEWAPHPNWYWIWSKYSLPFLDHPSVPKARFLSDFERVPDDLQNLVLKPLFSFAGGGVNVDPTEQDIAAIAQADRGRWLLQEKIDYTPVIPAADGGDVKVEVRMMFFRGDDDISLTLGQNLCRLARGKMLGVDFNKNFTWVGSSVGMWKT
jgi:hypothetical protein